jgi:hypothetical protein
MTPDPPLFNPLFLNIGLSACGAHEDPFFIEHPSLFLHRNLFRKRTGRMAQRLSGLQGFPVENKASPASPGALC